MQMAMIVEVVMTVPRNGPGSSTLGRVEHVELHPIPLGEHHAIRLVRIL
jgi:hypothetical protein